MQLEVGETSSGGVNETSPDMLKNTPSNIIRLYNEIEQYEGRQKYLAQTKSPSDGDMVRWYFCKVPLAVNEVAASVPRTEIVGKGDYFRFGMRDSLAIEASFLQREEELLSSWWKEFAECSEGPKGQPSSSSKLGEFSSENLDSVQLHTTEEERVGVPVKGGLYEVDLVMRHCFPVYWNGENRRVVRGHWFACKGGLDWLPLREDVSEQLEYAYRSKVWRRRTFQPTGLFAARVELQGSKLVVTSEYKGLHALFTGDDNTWEAWLNVDASGLSRIVTFGERGAKLRRGYDDQSQLKKPTQDELRQRREEEMDDYCSQVPVRHLVFMVHGIGQRLEKSNLVDDVGEFRHITVSVAERHLSSHQLGTQRVLYIPCQWRKGLKLSGEAAVEKVTLDGVRGLRTMLSATAHDVLYYMSPIHCQDIIDSVSNQLNRLYLKFLKRNPGYDGKVSLYGHSLGSVLSFDILCHQETLSSPFPMEWMYTRETSNEETDLSSACKPVEDNKPIEDNEDTKDKPSFIEDHIEGTSNPSYPPEPSESDDSTIIDEHANEPVEDLGLMEIHESDIMNDPNSIDTEVGPSSDNIPEEEISDKDVNTRSLMEEIDMLKKKIKEYEAELAKKSVAVVNQPDLEGVHSGHTDPVKNYTPQIRYTKLEFKVDTFFAVGSPLGVFLSLRNVRIGMGKGKHYWEEENIHEEIPACRQMFNIFHPFDPVAYRIEPLVCKEFIHKRPIIIPYHRGGKRLYVGFQEFKEGLASRSQAVMDQLHSIKVKVVTLCDSRRNNDQDEEPENTQEEKSYGVVMMERLTGSQNGRVDHMLQDKTFRHPYISAIGSHTNYWRDYDTALFMLKHLYRDIPEDPHSLRGQQSEGSSEDGSTSSKGWSDPREVDDEEYPLTFADNKAVKSFSYKAKKLMKP